MSANPTIKISGLSTTSASCLAMSLLLPEVRSSSEGFAGAISNSPISMGLIVVSALLAIFVLIYTIKNYSIIDTSSRIIGVIPCFLIAFASWAVYVTQ